MFDQELLPLRTKMAEKIDAGSLEAVQRVMHAPVMRLWDAMHPPNGSITPDVVPLSIDLEFWTPQGCVDCCCVCLSGCDMQNIKHLDCHVSCNDMRITQPRIAFAGVHPARMYNTGTTTPTPSCALCSPRTLPCWTQRQSDSTTSWATA